jgi:2-polyprenyl-3-methyl-5-hydroxy-6-metoxy-1,4-benzoquinol methylase
MELDTEAIRREKAEIVARYGKWTAHNIHLVDDVYTIQSGLTGDEFRLRRVMQIIADLVGDRPPQDLRVLDLACLERMYSVELARKGATVVAIEGREANIAKAAFAKRVLRLNKIELIQDDVRNLSREAHGKFDIVLCLGILYHLDSPDVFTFIERLADVCTGFAIIATHTSVAAVELQTHQDHEGISLQPPRARRVHDCIPVPHSARDHLRMPGIHHGARLVDFSGDRRQSDEPHIGSVDQQPTLGEPSRRATHGRG